MPVQKNKNMFRVFLSYSIPCIIAMFLTSFITVVDGIFIGAKMGGNGLAAVNLTLPVLYILLALTIMIGVGGVTLASHSLGEKNHHQANQKFTFALTINLLLNLVCFITLFCFQEQIIGLLNAKGNIYGYVRDYLGTMKYFYLFMMLNLTFSMFIRSEGKPQLSLLFSLAGNIINIILDYLFIIKFNWGMKGAAVASGISVIIPFVFGIGYFLSRRSVYKFVNFNFQWPILKKMLFLGFAEFIGQISLSITIYLFNWMLLKRIGINGVAAFNIIGYISFIENMILTGIAVGVHPVISYHFGAKNHKIILELLQVALKSVVVIGIATFLLSLVAGNMIVGIFAKDNIELYNIANLGLNLFSISFILNGYNIFAAAYFTSLGDYNTATLISILRSLILVCLLIIILPYLIGNSGIWLTAPLTELITFAVSFNGIRRSVKGLLLVNEPLKNIQN